MMVIVKGCVAKRIFIWGLVLHHYVPVTHKVGFNPNLCRVSFYNSRGSHFRSYVGLPYNYQVKRTAYRRSFRRRLIRALHAL